MYRGFMAFHIWHTSNYIYITNKNNNKPRNNNNFQLKQQQPLGMGLGYKKFFIPCYYVTK